MLLAFALASCSPSHQGLSEKGEVEGTIYSIGNDPFTKLGLEIPGGTVYILKCTHEMEKELNTKQGTKVKVHYESRDETPEGVTLTVMKIEYPSTKQ
jgi:hypothetical protein